MRSIPNAGRISSAALIGIKRRVRRFDIFFSYRFGKAEQTLDSMNRQHSSIVAEQVDATVIIAGNG